MLVARSRVGNLAAVGRPVSSGRRLQLTAGAKTDIVPIAKIIDELVARIVDGPFRFRFIVQPMMAILFGLRDGFIDAKAGSAPFLYGLLFHRQDLKPSVQSAVRRLRFPILFAIVLDAIVQYVMFQTVRPLTAVLVGTLLMGIPYCCARGISCRIIRSRRRTMPTRTASL